MNAITAIPTRTGSIFVDTAAGLEWLTVGDYGKGKNIKANFLGYCHRIDGVTHQAVDLEQKWVITVSTQKGCSCSCTFCDVPGVPFRGNVNVDEFKEMLTFALNWDPCAYTRRLNLHYARMGEPTFNSDILRFTAEHLDDTVAGLIVADVIHPVVSTMLPQGNGQLEWFLREWCDIKASRGGEAGLQFSIQSTDNVQRYNQFRGFSLPLEDIAAIAERLPTPVGRKYTLNFAITEDTLLDATKLSALFDSAKWLVKLTPVHKTNAANINGFKVTTSYDRYDVYSRFEEPLLVAGFDVIVFVPSIEEDSDRITCGNALLAEMSIAK